MSGRQSLDGYSFAELPFWGVPRSRVMDFVRSLGVDPNEVTGDGLQITGKEIRFKLKAQREDGRDFIPKQSVELLTAPFVIDILDEDD